MQAVPQARDLPFWFIILCAVTLPFGPALQNVVQFLGLFLLTLLWKQSRFQLSTEARNDALRLLVCAFAFIGTMAVASLLNADTSPNLARYFFGYLPWALYPAILASLKLRISKDQQKRLIKYFSWVMLIWGLIALSQLFYGWRIKGTTVVDNILRSYGLYSHPLSLAYVNLLIWPLALNLLKQSPRSLASWLIVLGNFIIIVGSQSRAVQAGAIVVALWAFWCDTTLRSKKYLALAFVLLLSVTFLTPNPVARKFTQTFSAKGVDRSSDYPDDRVAFWHVHGLMVLEKPIFGHGWSLNEKYRKPYYQSIGLGGFNKQYEAHNSFLQILSEGGLVALLCFLAWWGQLWRIVKRKGKLERRVFMQTLSFFFAASLLQNSFQDFEVRWTLVLLTSLLLMLPDRYQEELLN